MFRPTLGSLFRRVLRDIFSQIGAVAPGEPGTLAIDGSDVLVDGSAINFS